MELANANLDEKNFRIERNVEILKLLKNKNAEIKVFTKNSIDINLYLKDIEVIDVNDKFGNEIILKSGEQQVEIPLENMRGDIEIRKFVTEIYFNNGTYFAILLD